MPLDAHGRRYYVINGKPHYNVPLNTIARPDESRPRTGVFQDATWDASTGTWKKTLNKTSLVGALTLGAIAAPAAAAAAGAGGSVAAAGGAGTGVGTAGAGSVTAATGAAAAAGGGMASWLDPVLKYGLPAVGSLVNAKVQSGATKSAAADERRYTDLALQAQREQQTYEREQEAARIAREQEQQQYRRQQYTDFLTALQPYLQRNRGSVSLPGAANSGGGGMVALRAPTGEIRQVPEGQASHYLAQGASRV